MAPMLGTNVIWVEKEDSSLQPSVSVSVPSWCVLVSTRPWSIRLHPTSTFPVSLPMSTFHVVDQNLCPFSHKTETSPYTHLFPPGLLRTTLCIRASRAALPAGPDAAAELPDSPIWPAERVLSIEMNSGLSVLPSVFGPISQYEVSRCSPRDLTCPAAVLCCTKHDRTLIESFSFFNFLG